MANAWGRGQGSRCWGLSTRHHRPSRRRRGDGSCSTAWWWGRRLFEGHHSSWCLRRTPALSRSFGTISVVKARTLPLEGENIHSGSVDVTVTSLQGFVDCIFLRVLVLPCSKANRRNLSASIELEFGIRVGHASNLRCRCRWRWYLSLKMVWELRKS